MTRIDENTPTSEYAPFRDTSETWVVLNPNDIDIPACFKAIHSDEENKIYLTHETFKEKEVMKVYRSDILRLATHEEILSDVPNYD